jgi:lycopene beta-cyclase
MFDALVVGSGPAGTIIAGALRDRGLSVQGLSAMPLHEPWPNTYGIWRDELEPMGLTHLLGHCWENCVSYFNQGEVDHHRAYGLFDKVKLQNHLLEKCQGVDWVRGLGVAIDHHADHSTVTTDNGDKLQARIVVDASGHKPVFVERQIDQPVAFQSAYGIVGRFSSPPVEPGQFVLMDFRSDHLSALEKAEAGPTFLYAMDFGEGVFFVEETSLAESPGLGFELLERRLIQRLRSRSIEVLEIHEVERCLFPMNLPMPSFEQSVVGFGGAASMVHPASGYSVGAMLRRSSDLAGAISEALCLAGAGPRSVAMAGWNGLWPKNRLRKYYLYRLGLEKLMRFNEGQINNHFETFFELPQGQWSGFLADGLTTPELVMAMVRMFGQAPNDVRWGLMELRKSEGGLLWRSLSV